jgi:3-oxoacyl-[acyl-carrier protein] reductase
MAYSLDGRLALVTGASGGIGGAVALALARAGADLVLSYSGHRDEAEQVAAAATSLGRAATTVRADLGADGAGRDLAERAASAARPVDVLVANAGTGVQRAWPDVDDELWAQTFAVNVTAVWQLARAVLPGMVERGFGRILLVSSVAAFNGGVVGPHYAASKAALHGLMHHLAPRVAGSGVTVNTIAPALIAGTRMMRGVSGGSPPEASSPDPPLPIPVGRLGEPEEVADMALAMLANPYLTNKVIAVDGGIYPD